MRRNRGIRLKTCMPIIVLKREFSRTNGLSSYWEEQFLLEYKHNRHIFATLSSKIE